MPEIHIPLGKGIHGEADAKLLPQGLFTSMTNARIRKDLRVEARYGLNTLSAAPLHVFSAAATADGSLLSLTERSGVTPAMWRARTPDGTFTTAASTAALTDVAYVRRWAATRNDQSANARDSVIYDGVASIWSAHTDDGVGVTLTQYDPTSGATLWTTKLGTDFHTATLIPFASVNKVMLIFGASSGIAFRLYDVTAHTYTTGTLVGGVGAAAFDVCAATATTAALVYVDGSSHLQAISVTNAGAVTAVISQTAAASIPAIAYDPSTLRAAILWLETGGPAIKYISFDFPAGTGVTGLTLDTAATIGGYPVAGVTASGWAFFWQHDAVGAPVSTDAPPLLRYYQAISAVTTDFYGLAILTKPFAVGGAYYIWAADHSKKLSSAAYTTGTAFLVSLADSALEAQAGYLSVRVNNSTYGHDPRTTVGAASSTETPSQTNVFAAVPVSAGNGLGSDMILTAFGTNLARANAVTLNGLTTLAAPIPQEFDGRALNHEGLWDGPQVVFAEAAASGTVPVGTYQYVVTWEWSDNGGRIHRSPPSVPVTVTISSTAKNITVYAQAPTVMTKRGAVVVVYRTQDAGTTFYRINPNVNTPIVANSATWLSVLDTSTDAEIATNEILYSQGARGAISGLLPNDTPPPCRFIWAGNDRLFVGGLEDPTQVQWSKLLFPGEPLTWAISNQYMANVDAPVTGVAALDGTWLVFTKDSIWQINGDGPDDNGSGFFASPRRLPSTVGCLSHASIVEVDDGLIFQGTT
jgi:hypothetical protein